MSEYEKASRGSYYLFISQIVAIIGGIIVLVVFSAYVLASFTGLAKYANITESISSGFNFTSSSTQSVLAHLPVSMMSNMMNALLVLIVAGTVVGFVELLLMIYGWKNLSEFNSSEYHTPYIGSIMSFIGFLLVAPPGAFMIYSVKGALIYLETSQSVPPQILAEALVSAIPMFVGTLVIFAGYIMVLIGFWRLGSQFNSTIIKTSIILLIISIVLSIFSTVLPLLPEVLDIVSVILLTVGLYSVSKKAKTKQEAAQNS